MTKIIYYKIFLTENPNECYIGSCLDFARRKSQHKKNTTNKTKKSYWNNLYFFIRLKGGWENITMIKILEVELETKDHRKEYEQALIDHLRPTLNSINVIPNNPNLENIINKLKELGI